MGRIVVEEEGKVTTFLLNYFQVLRTVGGLRKQVIFLNLLRPTSPIHILDLAVTVISALMNVVVLRSHSHLK